MITKLYNICASTGKFTDRNGNTKNCYIRVGSVLKRKYGFPEQEEQANARLIAAAPEMYDELYEALQLCEGKSSYDGDEFASHAKSIRELLARIDGEDSNDE